MVTVLNLFEVVCFWLPSGSVLFKLKLLMTGAEFMVVVAVSKLSLFRKIMLDTSIAFLSKCFAVLGEFVGV